MRSFIVFGLVLVSVGQAQFGPDVRVSDTTGGFFGCVEPWIVAGPGDILYAVWASDYTSGFDFHIYFSRSTDLGNTWSPGKRIDDSPEGGCLYPSLAVDASGNLYCAWLEIRTGGDQIRFTRSTDGGMTWIPTIRVDDAPGGAFLERPHLVANQNELWVIWDDDRGKRPVNLFQRRIRNLALRVDDRDKHRGWHTRFSKSTDLGDSWSPSVRASGGIHGSLVARGDTGYVAVRGITVTKTTDGGGSWSGVASPGSGDFPSLALTPDGAICCLWYHWQGSLCSVFFSKSTDGGSSWSAPVTVTDTLHSWDSYWGERRANIVALDETRLVACWQDARYGYSGYFGGCDIFYAWSDDGGVTWSGNIMVNDVGIGTGAAQRMPLLSHQGDNFYMVWDDSRGFGPVGPSHIYFDKGSLVRVAEAPFSSSLVEVFPNPFRDRVTIRWRIEDGRWKPEDISLKIYDATGRLVKEFIPPTAYSSVPTVISWDGRDESGRKVGSGVYFLRFEAGDHRTTKKLLLVK